MFKRLFFITLFPIATAALGQYSNIETSIDSLIAIKTSKSFNGVILIEQNGKILYSKAIGYSDLTIKKSLERNDEFVIGSISKQFTAVIVLQEFDKGHLDLFTPIHTYLPELSQTWSDTITVHQLLTHTHGITTLDQATRFKAGTTFAYSQIGYDLLARIVERTSGKSFAKLSGELFKKCGMQHTFHPDVKKYNHLVKGYTEQSDGTIVFDGSSFENYAAAGAFVSTANDLDKWNNTLHRGKLLKESTYNNMLSKQKNALRQHPIFGITAYGYGFTIDDKEGILQIGQTGFAPGFVSMNFYFPQTQTSVIILENIAYDMDDLKKAFHYHTEILELVRGNLK